MTAKNGRQSASARAETAPDKNGFSLISDEKLIELYAAMVKSRMLAKHAAALKKRGVVAGDLNASVGREAAVAGVAVDLLPEDTLSPSQWDFVSSFIKGMTLDGMFSHLGAGNEHSHWPAKLRFDPKANVIVPAPNLGARLDMACGVALVHRTAKNGKIVVVTCGDAADTVESWRDPIRFAGFHELPMVFVWHNDGEDEREIRMPQGRSGDSPIKDSRPQCSSHHCGRQGRRGCVPGSERIDPSRPKWPRSDTHRVQRRGERLEWVDTGGARPHRQDGGVPHPQGPVQRRGKAEDHRGLQPRPGRRYPIPYPLVQDLSAWRRCVRI